MCSSHSHSLMCCKEKEHVEHLTRFFPVNSLFLGSRGSRQDAAREQAEIEAMRQEALSVGPCLLRYRRE